MCFLLVLLDNRVEGGAARAAGYRDGVHVEFYCEHAALVSLSHLFCDIEDEGGVQTVVELHLQVEVVAFVVAHLLGALQSAAVLSADAEGEQSAAGDVHLLAVHVAVVLPVGLEAHCDGILAGPSGVEH